MAKARKREILVVEDEASVLLTYRMLLEEKGYAVVAAISSDEARKALDRRKFDLVVCDLSLERNRTGLEIFDYARRRSPSVPCVLLTGYADKDTTERAEQSGVTVFFKPIEVEEFLQTVHKLSRHSHGEQAKAHGG